MNNEIKYLGYSLLCMTPLIGDFYIHKLFKKGRDNVRKGKLMLEEMTERYKKEGLIMGEETRSCIKDITDMQNIFYSKISEGAIIFSKNYLYGFVVFMSYLSKN